MKPLYVWEEFCLQQVSNLGPLDQASAKATKLWSLTINVRSSTSVNPVFLKSMIFQKNILKAYLRVWYYFSRFLYKEIALDWKENRNKCCIHHVCMVCHPFRNPCCTVISVGKHYCWVDHLHKNIVFKTDFILFSISIRSIK